MLKFVWVWFGFGLIWFCQINNFLEISTLQWFSSGLRWEEHCELHRESELLVWLDLVYFCLVMVTLVWFGLAWFALIWFVMSDLIC